MNSTMATSKAILYCFLFFRTAASEKYTKTPKGSLSLLNKIHQKKSKFPSLPGFSSTEHPLNFQIYK